MRAILLVGLFLAVPFADGETIGPVSRSKSKSSVSTLKSVKILHYNIKELDSFKIITQYDREFSQLAAAANIINSHSPDILSLNEIQYDMPGVPDDGFSTLGNNLNRLAPLFGMIGAQSVFFPANTGKRSCKKPERQLTATEISAFINRRYDCPMDEGSFLLSRPSSEDRKYFSDPVSFGMFPGQYSTGMLSKLPVVRVNEIGTLSENVKWKQVNPELDLSVFADGNGARLPENMELFDKNFTHVLVELDGEPLHVILLHTVPSFGFGNNRTPNFQRNHDQLRFMQWYLGGEGSGIERVEGVSPLPSGTSFVALGDWNVDPQSGQPGAQVIEELKQEFQLWMEPHTPTYVGSGFKPGGFQAQFDYILLSKDLKIKQASVYHPEAEREELGCDKPGFNDPPPGKTRVSYRNDEGQGCFAYVSIDYYELKNASDHLPLYVEISR